MKKNKVVWLGCLMSLISSSLSFAIPPPKIIKARNLEAKIIVIGKVIEVNKLSPTHFFELQVIHVVKGYNIVKEGENIRVCFKGEPAEKNGIKAHIMGEDLVKVKEGEIVICYLNPASKANLFTPLLQGLSVFSLKIYGGDKGK